MDQCERVRRFATLCCHCVRNIAYYKAGWNGTELIFDEDFWCNANGNFLDISVLEWCKLFADTRGKYHWRRFISCKELPIDQLHTGASINQDEFDQYVVEVRSYRNKFVAHLDEKPVMHIPLVNNMKTSTSLIYSDRYPFFKTPLLRLSV